MWFATAACIFSLLACAYAPGGHTRLCHHCDHLTDPSQCNVYQKCHHEEHCETEVRVENNQYVYKMGCKPTHECGNFVGPILGKRAPGHDHGQIVCKQCCDTTGCNKDLCGAYLTTTTAATTTTVIPTPAASATTTTSSNLCQDFEDDTFRCSDYDKYHLCDTEAGLGYELGHKRCQKHCGFCNRNGTLSNFVTKLETPSTGATVALPMTSLPPVDITAETKTNPPVTAAASMETSTTQPNTSPQMTSLPPVVNATVMASQPSVSSAAANTTAWVPIAANVTVGPLATKTMVCMDFEDASFTCAEWSSHGFCQMSTGQGHEIAKLRCAKYCGFCQ